MTMASGFGALLALAAGCMVLAGIGFGAVVINEVELSPPGNVSIWVELYNTGDAPVDLTGWVVSVRDGPWVGPIPMSGIIEPRGFSVAVGDARWVPVDNATVELRDASGTVVDATPQLSDLDMNDFTQARLPDGKDTDTRGDFVYYMGSKGRSNTGGSIGGISI